MGKATSLLQAFFCSIIARCPCKAGGHCSRSATHLPETFPADLGSFDRRPQWPGSSSLHTSSRTQKIKDHTPCRRHGLPSEPAFCADKIPCFCLPQKYLFRGTEPFCNLFPQTHQTPLHSMPEYDKYSRSEEYHLFKNPFIRAAQYIGRHCRLCYRLVSMNMEGSLLCSWSSCSAASVPITAETFCMHAQRWFRPTGGMCTAQALTLQCNLHWTRQM